MDVYALICFLTMVEAAMPMLPKISYKPGPILSLRCLELEDTSGSDVMTYVHCGRLASQQPNHYHAIKMDAGQCVACRLNEGSISSYPGEVSVPGPHIYADLVMIQETVTWSAALSRCQENYQTLVTIDSSEKKQAVYDFIQDMEDMHGLVFTHIWLGANSLDTVGTYVWVGTGEPLVYEDWNTANSQPNGAADQRCVAYHHALTNRWWDDPCNDPKMFICESPLIKN